MCKHVVLVPMMTVDSAMQKKTCKPAMLGRLWAASRRELSLEHAPAHQFGCCQWQAQQRPPVAYLIYRWLLFIGVVSVGIASFACQRLPKHYEGPPVELNHMKWFIYFTNWGFIVIALQCGLALATVHRYRAERIFNLPVDSDSICDEFVCAYPVGTFKIPGIKTWENTSGRRQRTPMLCRVYWVTHTVATDLAFVITLVYWTLVHDPKVHEVNALNLLVHGGNSLVMVVELLVTSHPVRAAHALYGASAGVAYGLFSALYWAAGGTDRLGLTAIYPALDWNKPASAFGFVALCAVVMVFAHALSTCAAGLRARLASRLAARDRVALPHH